MNEFFNFHNSWILVEQNWMYVLLAFGLGALVGFMTCEPVRKSN